MVMQKSVLSAMPQWLPEGMLRKEIVPKLIAMFSVYPVNHVISLLLVKVEIPNSGVTGQLHTGIRLCVTAREPGQVRSIKKAMLHLIMSSLTEQVMCMS